MATINFNANEVEPSVGYEAIPAGKYQAVIVESDMKPNKAGTGEYLQLEFEVIEGEFKGRKLWRKIMGKCSEKCEIYSRVTGYYRPVSNWNKGKQQEFKDRKMFEVQQKCPKK